MLFIFSSRLFSLHCFSYLHSFFPLISLSLPCFSHLPSSIWVLWVWVGEKVHGIFPQLGRTRPNPTPTHFLSFPPLPSVSCQRGVLKKTTHTPPPSILDVCWNFMLLVVPQTSTACCYGDRIIRRSLRDPEYLCLWIKTLYAIKHLIWKVLLIKFLQKGLVSIRGQSCFETV